LHDKAGERAMAIIKTNPALAPATDGENTRSQSDIEHFVSSHAGRNNMLGIYRLAEDGSPTDPEIILPSTHDAVLVNSLLTTFETDQDIRFFLIPNGGDMDIDFGRQLHFVPNGHAWELSVGELDNSRYADVRFDDPTFNPTSGEGGLLLPHDQDTETAMMTMDGSDVVKMDELFHGGENDDLLLGVQADVHHTVGTDNAIHIDPSILADTGISAGEHLLGATALAPGQGMAIKGITYGEDLTQLLVGDSDGGHEVVVNLLGVNRADLSGFETGITPDTPVDDLIQYLIDSGHHHT